MFYLNYGSTNYKLTRKHMKKYLIKITASTSKWIVFTFINENNLNIKIFIFIHDCNFNDNKDCKWLKTKCVKKNFDKKVVKL